MRKFQPPFFILQYDESVATAPHDPNRPKFDGIYNRVQDKELLEVYDLRKCISMHQPWASLLVAGIKKHEGRPWYTSHRGRLWIASTAKPVEPEAIQYMEKFYRRHYNDDSIEFPNQYPSGCLLGCALVQVKRNKCLEVLRRFSNSFYFHRIACRKKSIVKFIQMVNRTVHS